MHVGYGIMGQPFASGHVLALRRFVSSSIGDGYVSVWHRDPAGRWRILSDAPGDLSCPRYFGAAVAHAETTRIDLAWEGPHALRVHVPDRLDWRATLAATPATRAMSAMARMMPERSWRSPAVLGMMGRVGGAVLRAGRMRMRGVAPNGQRFRVAPRQVWTVASTSATVDGADVGAPGPVAPQASLGDFMVPQRGLFAVGSSTFWDARDAPA